MRAFGLWALAIFLIVLAGELQVTMVYRIDIFGAAPDLGLVVLISLSLLIRPAFGALAGFLSGLLTGVHAGATIAYYVLTRAACGFVLGRFEESDMPARTAALVGAGSTLAVQLALMIFAPSPDLGEYVRVSLIQSVLNGILTWPVYAGLQRVYRPKVV